MSSNAPEATQPSEPLEGVEIAERGGSDVAAARPAAGGAAEADMSSLWPAYVVLTLMAVVVLGAAVLRFRRELAPNLDAQAGSTPAAEVA